MAVKPVKTITINSTKYKVGGGAEAIFIYNHYDSAEGVYVTDAIKDIEGNVLTNADVCSKVKAGAQIYVQVVAASGSNSGKFQLLDKYKHEEMGGGSVIQEVFWSDDNSFDKYISMTFRLSTNWVSAPYISDTVGGEFIIRVANNQNMFSDGSKTLDHSFDVTALAAAVKAGKTVKIYCADDGDGEVVFCPTVKISEQSATVNFNGYFAGSGSVLKQFTCLYDPNNPTISALNLYAV